MLTSLKVKNFKRLEDVEIELGKTVVFVGPNNSGKTTGSDRRNSRPGKTRDLTFDPESWGTKLHHSRVGLQIDPKAGLPGGWANEGG